jgi:hypothetical protein
MDVDAVFRGASRKEIGFSALCECAINGNLDVESAGEIDPEVETTGE